MLNKLKIKHFRGIESLDASEFGQINLLIGSNNCGKSSVLEAVFLISNPKVPPLDIRINNFRDLRNPERIDTLFKDMDVSRPVVLSFDRNDNNYDLSISYFSKSSAYVEGDTEIQRFGLLHSLKSNGEDVEVSNNSLTLVREIKENSDKVVKVEDFNLEVGDDDLFIDTRFLQDSTNINFLQEIIKDKHEKQIVSVLQKIDSRITDIVFDSSEQIALVDIGLSVRIPINVMGDGIRRVLAVIVAIYQQKNGILLLDEFDNGVYFKNMPVLWRAIVESAIQFNVQIFATTHSLDSLRGLNKALMESDVDQGVKDSVKTLYLQNNDGAIKVLSYDYLSFQSVIDSEIEIR